MNAKELRIGNMIIYEATTHIVCGVNVDYINSIWHKKPDEVYFHSINHVQPIPLTEEWLMKFGFEKPYDESDEFCIEHEEFTFVVEFFDYTQSYHFTGGEGVRFGKGFKYVHEMQNLYFALTGEELKLSE